MKGRVLVLDELGGRQAAALLVDGRLEELAIDPEGDVAIPGAIYRAVADRPVKGQGGIFVKLPEGSGFLRQISGVAPGQRLLVQVTGPAEPGKAVPVTTRLLFKSRFAIITPDAPGLNISRRIRDEERRAELSALAEAGMSGAADSLGLILRSGCVEAEDQAIAEDIAAMRGLAEAVLADVNGPPELLVDGPSAHDLAFRDWLDPPVDDADTDPESFERHGVIEAVEALRTPR
ncbi:MAG: ribonuclease E/G, partial [Tabrizicola sp.]